ncbi:hypothetical protein BCV70DRAFT_198236 [Testicularia cyperi]|uniref:RING-type domain-containing protein n=1 Tax=Testicularia cyperi TaxID=1882483 RepID=A0A317XVM5_9BASI|nr:hypothetical protein BCV70DRAFT_198236 [Testicularia cyperi]
MSQSVLEAYHYGRNRISSVVGSPLRKAYSFVFPPLDGMVLEDGGGGGAVSMMQRRASEARRAALEHGVVGGGQSSRLPYSSSSSAGAGGVAAVDDELIEAWDSFSQSPWSFVTSRYTMALIIVAVITNRIQNICRPRGRASPLSISKRIALRLPSILLLLRSVFIITTIVADYFLSEKHPINLTFRRISTASWRDSWLADKPMEGWALDFFGSANRDAVIRARDATALWASFTSTSVAVITDCLIRNLDADREEPPSFNLVGFAFLLHFHTYSADAPANQHVYICVLLQLLHILLVTISKCRKRPLLPRLYISSFFGILALVHYGLTVPSGQYPFMEAFSRTPEIALIIVIALTVFLHALTMLLLEGRIEVDRLLFSRSNLPSLNEDWSVALFKLGTACMESTRLTGLDREVAPLVTFDEPYLELKQSGQIELVTRPQQRQRADHSTTSRTGLDGQDASASSGFDQEIKQIRFESSQNDRSLGHLGFARVRPAIQFIGSTTLVLRNLTLLILTKTCRILGLPDPGIPRFVFKTLRIVRLVWHGQNGEARRAERRRERERVVQQRLEAQLGPFQTHRDSSGTRQSSLPSAAPLRPSNSATTASTGAADASSSCPSIAFGSALDPTRRGPQQTLWTPSQAEDYDDIDDDEFDGESSGSLSEAEWDEEERNEMRFETEELQIDAAEMSGLLEDIKNFSEQNDEGQESTAMTLHVGSEGFNQLLLAHFARRSDEPPLTRSGYSSLLSHVIPESGSSRSTAVGDGSPDLHLARTIVERRGAQMSPASTAAAATGGSRNDLRRLCVVCCVEERNVICWPCRCLCLCMECREHLASRPPNRNQAPPPQQPRGQATHLCPTCRTPVLAFSRLYIP